MHVVHTTAHVPSLHLYCIMCNETELLTAAAVGMFKSQSLKWHSHLSATLIEMRSENMCFESTAPSCVRPAVRVAPLFTGHVTVRPLCSSRYRSKNDCGEWSEGREMTERESHRQTNGREADIRFPATN